MKRQSNIETKKPETIEVTLSLDKNGRIVSNLSDTAYYLVYRKCGDEIIGCIELKNLNGNIAVSVSEAFVTAFAFDMKRKSITFHENVCDSFEEALKNPRNVELYINLYFLCQTITVTIAK